MRLVERLQQLQPRLLAGFQRQIRQDRLSHAYLFVGEFGSFDMALYLAQSLFCEALTEEHLPCGCCRSCRLVADGDFADVTVLEPSGLLIKTEQVRALAQNFAQAGYEGANQVFIIKEADRLHRHAANSLLKQIEEPNSPYLVILLTSHEDKVLPTIKSRCQVYRFVANRAYLTQTLEEAGLLKTQAQVLAQLTDNPDRVADLAGQKKVLDLLRLAQGFLEQSHKHPDEAYLQVGRLVALATDKTDQDLCLQLLTILAGQGLQLSSSAMLQKIHEVRRMWQANVSFQNVLDYLVLSLEEGR